MTLNHIGEIHREQGQYAKAKEYYQKALDLSRKIQSLEAEADVLHNLGEVLRLQGRYNQAMTNYLNALKTYRQLGDRLHEGIALTNIGTVYSLRGQHAQATDSYAEALDVLHQGGMLREEARTTLDLGRMQQSRREFDEALSSFKKGLDLYKTIGVDTSLPAKRVGDVYLDMNKPEKAGPFVKEAGSPALTGRLYLFREEYEHAQREYAKLLQSAEANRNVEDLFTAHTGLGKTYEALEAYEKAEAHYAKGMNMIEEIRSSLLPAERRNFFQVRINGFSRSEPAKGLTRVRMKLNRSAESIIPSEATRARAFADRLSQRSDTEHTRVPQEILAEERELVTRIAALMKARNSVPKKRNPQRYDELSRKIDKAEDDLEIFIEQLRKDHPAYAAIRYPRPVTLRESELRPDEHVLMFDVSDKRVGVTLIIGKEIAPTFSLPYPAAELEADVNRFRSSFEQVNLKRFDPKLGKKLYRKLLAPVLSYVPEGTPLIIIPHEILAVLPFEALVVKGNAAWKNGDKGGYPDGITYLGDVYPISYYQSITALTLVRKEATHRRPGDKVLVLADPVFGAEDDRLVRRKKKRIHGVLEHLPENLMAVECNVGLKFDRLPLTRQLGDSLNALYPDKADVYMGMDAAKSRLMDNPLMDYGVIVFGTHGYYNADLPCVQEPILVLASTDPNNDMDGLLRMTEVTGLQLNADLVALTACQTGVGERVSGEGTTSMGWAFQCAGAKSVLMTLWSVSEQASVKLMEDFFRHLKAGKNKLEALTLARSELRQAGYRHPFYWAPFILVGETR